MGRWKCTLNEHVFDVIDTEAKAYWLGYLYCDGCVRKKDNRVELGPKDRDQLVKFCAFCSTNYLIRSLYPNGYLNYHVTLCGAKHLVTRLIQLGVVPRKTYNHSVPVYIPEGNLAHHFWRGCIDADGSFGLYPHAPNRKAVTIQLANKNKSLLDSFLQFINLGRVKEMKWGWEWDFSGQHPQRALPLLRTLYQNSTIYLDRKF